MNFLFVARQVNKKQVKETDSSISAYGTFKTKHHVILEKLNSVVDDTTKTGKKHLGKETICIVSFVKFCLLLQGARTPNLTSPHQTRYFAR